MSEVRFDPDALAYVVRRQRERHRSHALFYDLACLVLVATVWSRTPWPWWALLLVILVFCSLQATLRPRRR